MGKVRLTKLFRLEMAHALVGYDGLCSQIHGHSYRFEVTVESDNVLHEEGAKMGMALDFGEIKSIVECTVVARFDHSLTLRRCAATEELLGVLCRHFERINAVEWQPTCENLLAHFAELIAPHLPTGVRLYSLRLHETEHNCAELVL